MQKIESYARYWHGVRESRGLTQQQMADTLGIRFQFISAVERGSSRYSVEQISNLIRRFKLDVRQVIEVIMASEETRLRAGVGARKKKILRA